MQVLEKHEMGALLPVKRKRMTLLRAQLEQLEVGQGLFLPKEEWKTKNTPRYIIAAITQKSGYQYEWGFKTDGTGWLFRRIK